MMKIKIYDKNIEIKINKNIKDLNDEDIYNIYITIKSIKNYEIENGNEIEKSQLYISYKKNMIIKEYINIFTIVRYGTLHDVYKYFKNFNELKNTQNITTNININDYINSYENIVQIIIINFMFKVKIEKNIINKQKEKLEKIIKIDDIKIK